MYTHSLQYLLLTSLILSFNQSFRYRCLTVNLFIILFFFLYQILIMYSNIHFLSSHGRIYFLYEFVTICNLHVNVSPKLYPCVSFMISYKRALYFMKNPNFHYIYIYISIYTQTIYHLHKQLLCTITHNFYIKHNTIHYTNTSNYIHTYSLPIFEIKYYVNITRYVKENMNIKDIN